LPWIVKQSVVDRSVVSSLLLRLDPGEAETIALAIEASADIVLLDERKARRVASRFGLKYVGTAGIPIEAKHHAYVAEVKPLLDRMISASGFRISSGLYDLVLQTAGEGPGP